MVMLDYVVYIRKPCNSKTVGVRCKCVIQLLLEAYRSASERDTKRKSLDSRTMSTDNCPPAHSGQCLLPHTFVAILDIPSHRSWFI